MTEAGRRVLGPPEGRVVATIHLRDRRLERIRLEPVVAAREEAGPPEQCGVADAVHAWLGAVARDPRCPPPPVPLAEPRTPFQGRLRQRLQALAPGETVTYRELARALGSAPRAVAMAARANPLPLVVPCHRVVAVAGPGGYAGAAEGPLASFKAWLLEREAGHGVD
ncbi:MAG: methylated-DNA--[protein]-cysteine S-methyltransferase [Thiohalospira sp.]